jgi:hypothetical protein
MRPSLVKRAFSLLPVLALAACAGGHTALPASPAMQSDGAPMAATRGGVRRPHTACSTYTPFAGTGGINISFANLSGITTPAYLYVYGVSKYLNTSTGKMTAFPVSGVASTYEYPLSCFIGASAMQFVLPPGSSYRVYISFGTLTIPSSGIPACCEPPNVPTGFVNPNYKVLWDLFEYSYPATANGINIDTSQVDSFALPLYLTVKTGGASVSVGTKQYAAIINDFKTISPWNKLIVYGTVNGVKNSVLRVMSPDDATTQVGSPAQPFNAAFPQNYFTSTTYWNAPGGYLAAMLSYYATAAVTTSSTYHKIIYVAYQTTFNSQGGCNSSPTGGGATVCPTYYATSDGKSNFIFTLATYPSGTTKTTFPATITVPVSDLGEVNGINGIWGIPFALPGNPSIKQQIQFYMYKGLAADLNRGVAMQTGYHGVAPCATLATPPTGCATYFTPPVMPTGNNYYHSPNRVSGQAAIFSGYAAILHYYFVNGFSYAQSYDDFWTQASDIGTTGAPSSIKLTIEPMTGS